MGLGLPMAERVEYQFMVSGFIATAACCVHDAVAAAEDALRDAGVTDCFVTPITTPV